MLQSIVHADKLTFTIEFQGVIIGEFNFHPAPSAFNLGDHLLRKVCFYVFSHRYRNQCFGYGSFLTVDFGPVTVTVKINLGTVGQQYLILLRAQHAGLNLNM